MDLRSLQVELSECAYHQGSVLGGISYIRKGKRRTALDFMYRGTRRFLHRFLQRLGQDRSDVSKLKNWDGTENTILRTNRFFQATALFQG